MVFIRTTRVTSKGKSYEYVQLVESYRRKADGMPCHRVIANLGGISARAEANLRTALTASRQDRAVVIAEPKKARRQARLPKPIANLRYLDLAVLLELWSHWGLDELLGRLLQSENSKVSSASVIAALVLQRCVAPDSKLSSTRWLPRTALPELLDIKPEQFNNTRLHRVLARLEEVEGSLMATLAKKYGESDGAFATLFLDVTDAWFVGHGPALARRGKTKEGRIQRKIGIVLMCNEHGYPVRWDVVSGEEADNVVMRGFLSVVQDCSWAEGVPVVCDRALGTTSEIRRLVQTGLCFITSLRRTEFESYCPALPWQILREMRFETGEDRASTVERVSRHVQSKTTMQMLCAHRFAVDFGVVQCGEDETSGESLDTAECQSGEEALTEDITVVAMRACQRMTTAVESKKCDSYNTAGRRLGLTVHQSKKYRRLHPLAQDIKREIIAGRASGCSLAQLIRLASIRDEGEQRDAFAQLVNLPRRRVKTPTGATKCQREQPFKVRVVAYFDAERFVEQRIQSQVRLEKVQAFVADLNEQLAGSRSKLDRDGIVAKLDRELRSKELLKVFKTEVTEVDVLGHKRYLVRLEMNSREWNKRRRYDGFSVLIANPELAHGVEEMSKRYRAKDMVEKDFQVIKSVLQVRPVRHRSDDKVRAHVTLCMLALLLERTLNRRLGTSYTAGMALEILATHHLNLYRDDQGPSIYTCTQPTAEQSRILRSLRLGHLTEDDTLAERITPRVPGL